MCRNWNGLVRRTKAKGSRSRSRSRADLSSWFVLSYSPNPQTRNYNLFRTKAFQKSFCCYFGCCLLHFECDCACHTKKIQIHFGWISDLKAWVSCLICQGIPPSQRQTVSRFGQLKQICRTVELNHPESRSIEWPLTLALELAEIQNDFLFFLFFFWARLSINKPHGMAKGISWQTVCYKLHWL